MNARVGGAALRTLVIAGVLGLAVPAIAQNTQPNNAPNPTPPSGAGMAGTENRGAGQGENGAATAAPRGGIGWVQQEVERLHRQLKITAAEEAAWNQFADTMLANARHIDEMYQDRAQHFETMNAVENLKNYQTIIQAEADGLAKRAASFAALYETLSPEQKQASDRIFRFREQRREQRYMARHNG